jgi:lambda family phage minor tail protein L
MGQGQDRIAQSLLELEPTAIIELFQLYFNTVDKPNSFIAFHGGSVFQKGIVWQGIQYLPIPVETEGFEVNANGKLARPKIKVSNKDYFVTDLLLQNDDLQFAKLIRRRTFVKYLDDVNFDGGNPWNLADASAEISLDTFVVGQKTAENKSYVEFELTSPLDLENFEVNNRLIMSRYCSWYYRGNGCNYNSIPLATEDGRKLAVNFNQYKQASENKNIGEWKIGKAYVVGDTTYLENTKITVTNPKNNNEKSFAKIWYVCNQAHTSSSSNKPDTNQNFWDKDGCNKKLDGCKLRFGDGAVEFNDTTVDTTEHRVDFRSRHGSLKYNNIAPNAKVTVSSNTGAAYLINDLKTGSNLNWLSEKKVTGLVTLEWDTAKNITGLHIYDHTNTNNNYGNAYIRYFNSSNQVIGSGLMGTIPTNGLTPLTTGVNPNLSIKKIQISGSGGSAANVGLGEIAVFEANVPYMYYDDTLPLPLHRQDYFHIATKASFLNVDRTSNRDRTELCSIFHNIGFGNQSRYSGINLYVSGYNLCLDFAIRRRNQVDTIESQVKSLILPWDNDEYKPIHLICSGGSGSGTTPLQVTPGFIRLSYGDVSQEYTLNTLEYFKFKNPNFQGGIGISLLANNALKFGVNTWRYPSLSTLGSSPSASSDQIVQDMDLYSPISFGTTAIWTGGFAEDDRIEQFNLLPNYYSKVSGRNSIRSGLLGWWDMEHNGDGIIQGENNYLARLIVTGNNISSTQSEEIIQETLSSQINQPKQSIELPFGGFPGTEKYG